MRPLFLLLTAASVSVISGKGSISIVLNVTNARSAPKHPMKFDDIVIWCAPDHSQATIRAASFTRSKDNKKLPANIDRSKKNATLEIKEPTINDAGEYICELDLNAAPRAVHRTYIYSRPVLVSDETFTHNESDIFSLAGPSQSHVVGSEVILTCPAQGYPNLTFEWTKDGNLLEMGDIIQDGNILKFKKLNYTHAGVYSCKVVNEYEQRTGTAMRKVKTLLLLQRDLRVKSQYTWIWPLAIIILIFIALFIIIIACEYRKKHSDRKTLYVAQE